MLAVILAAGGAAIVVGAEHPNILLIMTDDQGWGDLSLHGNEILKTPTLDALGQSGARFDRFYVSPVCAPTRASLLTGRYHLRTGVHGVTRTQETMRENEVTLAEILRDVGYATGCFGKWHNGAHYPHHPKGQGFDQFVGFCAGHWNNYFDTTLEHNGKPHDVDGYIADVFTNRTIQFIEEHAKNDNPFLAYVAYNTPHSPMQVPDRYFEKYKAAGCDDRLAAVYGMCENIDDNVARLLATLDQLDVAQRTIVVFLTDNGPNGKRFNGGMRGTKGSVHEGGVRVPCFVHWPGQIQPGTLVKPIAAHIDLLPTLCNLAGVDAPTQLELDGMDLSPWLLGESNELPQRMLVQGRSPLPQQYVSRAGVRDQRFRAVLQNNRWELFDMHADPGQKVDVADQHPERLTEMQKFFDDWQQDVLQPPLSQIPTQIGHIGWPRVELHGHEATLHPRKGKGISYYGPNGWANDWITNWTAADAFAQWPIKTVRHGMYEVAVRYACDEDAVGTPLKVTIGVASVEGTIHKTHAGKFIPTPDRFGRKEAPEREWARQVIGRIAVDKGEHRLRLHIMPQPSADLDIKSIVLRRIEGIESP